MATTSEQEIREALQRHWSASAAGDLAAEHDIYEESAICEYPQSGERIHGRENLKSLRGHHPGRPLDSPYAASVAPEISGSRNI